MIERTIVTQTTLSHNCEEACWLPRDQEKVEALLMGFVFAHRHCPDDAVTLPPVHWRMKLYTVHCSACDATLQLRLRHPRIDWYANVTREAD